jgi:hypothetical protein
MRTDEKRVAEKTDRRRLTHALAGLGFIFLIGAFASSYDHPQPTSVTFAGERTDKAQALANYFSQVADASAMLGENFKASKLPGCNNGIVWLAATKVRLVN